MIPAAALYIFLDYELGYIEKQIGRIERWLSPKDYAAYQPYINLTNNKQKYTVDIQHNP